ncbi:14681_t:CDS:2 [Cetraspora pellucida]|uniref:ATP-dependent RNA helicase n=1 Tax=Cetraspora pellucida TaxID=1433469 RepID=A0A9N9NUX8_9GLOM|nr:14681_t:CDS:2 [Cetraspora pellucida]
MDNCELILNFVTQGPTVGNQSIRSKLKEVRGSWKEKNRVRRSLKKEIKKNSRSNDASLISINVEARSKTNVPEKQNVKKQSNQSNKYSNNGGNETLNQFNNHLNLNIDSNNKTQIISSIFTCNPEIVDIHENKISKRNTAHHKPSNAPINDISFTGMGLNVDLVTNVKDKLGVEKPTNAQKKVIPILLSSIQNNDDTGNKDIDIVLQAETGSGKTLAYLLPIVHRLIRITTDLQNANPKTRSPLSRSIGTLAIILTPTRELAKQILSVLESLLNLPPSRLSDRHLTHWIVPGSVIGGEKKQSEKARLRKGINILVCTPGRLLDHLSSTKSFVVEHLHWLVLDEADRLLELGFEETLQKILNLLNDRTESMNKLKNNLFSSPMWPKKRQTILCSATLKDDVKRLVGYSLSNPVYVRGNDDYKGQIYSTPNQLKQTYVIAPAKLRLVTLTAILKSIFDVEKNESAMNHKVIVFFSCCDTVDFHFDLFVNSGNFHKDKISNISENDTEWNMDIDEEYHDESNSKPKELRSLSTVVPKVRLFKLHGDLLQRDRTTTFDEFSKSKSGILFCTDVAARGLDLPNVAKIIQYDPPSDLKDYVHRVGRTARLGKKGDAILFLLPSEIEYIHVLRSHEIYAEPVQVETLLENLAPINENKDYKVTATDIQLGFEKYVYSDTKCITLARKAYSSFIRSYATHSASEKHIFHVKKLHLGHVAKGFGLREAPSNINSKTDLNSSNSKNMTKMMKSEKRLDAKLRNLSLKRIAEEDVNNEFSIGSYSSLLGPTTKRKRKNDQIK